MSGFKENHSNLQIGDSIVFIKATVCHKCNSLWASACLRLTDGVDGILLYLHLLRIQAMLSQLFRYKVSFCYVHLLLRNVT